jgi:tetratricopeptide (TPR) repeat protein
MSASAEPSPERIEEVFQEATGLAGVERSAYLERACVGDQPLRAMVEDLLRSAAAVAGDPAWASPAMVHVATELAFGAAPALDRYRVIGKLGAGGMGVVYRAERCDGAYQKQVAIKIVPWAAGDEKVIERLRRERAILAGLDHPYIARLFDGGTTVDGVPYLAMELAEGVPIGEFAVREKPPRKELIGLFRKICAAVSYAHRNLVVHQDLKPGNILVVRNAEGEAEPKVLDFGVAKLLDETGAATQTRALTPEYASPEQISGAPVTTASDVYSLGVLLYELIGGRRPYRPTTSVVDLAEVICKEDPVAPGPEFDGDLANIVLMALRKEPERRYASAEHLSEDLRRYLEGYPVAARPDTRRYRATKFLARHKAAVAAGVALALATGIGVTATVREANIANRRFNDVRKLANAYLFEFHDAIRDVPGTTAARQLVIRRGLEYLDQMSRERAGDRGLTRELASAYLRIGDVQGLMDHANLGQTQAALASYDKADRLFAEVLAAGRDTDAALGFADGHAKSGQILMQKGDLANAEAHQRKALETVEAYAPGSERARAVLPNYYAALAAVEGNPNFPNLGHTKQALDLYGKALERERALASAHPGDSDYKNAVRSLYNMIGQMQQALNDGPAAIDAFRKGLEISEALLKEAPGSLREQRATALAYRNLAVAYNRVMHNPRDAQPLDERALRLYRAIAAADPSNFQAKLDLADGLFSAGMTAGNLGNSSKELDWYNESIAQYEAVRKARPDTQPYGIRTAYQLRADTLLNTGDLTAALTDISTELQIDDDLLRTNAGNVSAQRNQAIAWAQTGRVHVTMAKRMKGAASVSEWRQALAWYEKADAMYVSQQTRGTFIPIYASAQASVRKQIAACGEALARAK